MRKYTKKNKYSRRIKRLRKSLKYGGMRYVCYPGFCGLPKPFSYTQY